MQRPSLLKAVVADGLTGLLVLTDAPATEEVTYAHRLDPIAWAPKIDKVEADVKAFMSPDAARG
ncbi:MAG: hypothetical protein WAN86_20515 [Hyphomicrobiaceae bacterium]